jgi:hypothetical protein
MATAIDTLATPTPQRTLDPHPAARALLDCLCGSGPLPEHALRRILGDHQLVSQLDELASDFAGRAWATTRGDLVAEHEWLLKRQGPTYAALCWRIVRDADGLGDPHGEAARFSAAIEMYRHAKPARHGQTPPALAASETRELLWLAQQAAADRRPSFPDEADQPLDEAELAALLASPAAVAAVVSEANAALLLLDEFPDLDLDAINNRLERELGETAAQLVWRTCAFAFDGEERWGEVERLYIRHRIYLIRAIEAADRALAAEPRRAAA